MGPRGKRFLVDGYNVILRLGIGAQNSLEERRNELVQRAAGLGHPCWIVFDSRERHYGTPKRASGRVRVEFARDGQTADEVILHRLRAAKDLDSVVVVTDDRELASACRFLGARTEAVAAFGAKLRPKEERLPEKERPLNRREVEEWLEYFGVEPDRKDDPESPDD